MCRQRADAGAVVASTVREGRLYTVPKPCLFSRYTLPKGISPSQCRNSPDLAPLWPLSLRERPHCPWSLSCYARLLKSIAIKAVEPFAVPCQTMAPWGLPVPRRRSIASCSVLYCLFLVPTLRRGANRCQSLCFCTALHFVLHSVSTLACSCAARWLLYNF